MHCYTYVKRTVLKKCLNCFISLQHGDTGILLLFSSRCSSSSSLSAGLNLKCCFYDNNPLRPAPGTETTEKDVFHIHPSSALSISAGAEASPSCYGLRQVTSLSQGNTTIPAHFYNDSQESLINLSFFSAHLWFSLFSTFFLRVSSKQACITFGKTYPETYLPSALSSPARDHLTLNPKEKKIPELGLS